MIFSKNIHETILREQILQKNSLARRKEKRKIECKIETETSVAISHIYTATVFSTKTTHFTFKIYLGIMNINNFNHAINQNLISLAYIQLLEFD